MPINKKMHQRSISWLIYLSYVRSDITYEVSTISQFMHNLKEVHLQTTYKILQYLKESPGKGIILMKNDKLLLKASIDGNYARHVVHRKSSTSYCTLFEDNLVTLRSKKQNVVTS